MNPEMSLIEKYATEGLMDVLKLRRKACIILWVFLTKQHF